MLTTLGLDDYDIVVKLESDFLASYRESNQASMNKKNYNTSDSD